MSGSDPERSFASAGTPSRRQFLGALTVVGGVGLAGCSGGGGNDTTDSGPASEGTGGESSGDGTGGDSGASSGGCPSLPLSYTEKELTGSPGLTFEGPTDAEYQVISQGSGGVLSAELTYPPANGGESWIVQIAGVRQESSTVDEAFEADSYGQAATEVTDEYDLADANTRVLYLDGQTTYEVYVPTDSVVLQVGVNPFSGTSDVACSEAATAVVGHVVETLRST
jgi:hypothetical protein